MAVSKLTWSSLVSRKARMVLTVLAIGLSVSLVIAVTSGYASAEAAVIRYFTEFMGSTDIKVGRFYAQFDDKPVTFLQLVWAYEATRPQPVVSRKRPRR